MQPFEKSRCVNHKHTDSLWTRCGPRDFCARNAILQNYVCKVYCKFDTCTYLSFIYKLYYIYSICHACQAYIRNVSKQRPKQRFRTQVLPKFGTSQLLFTPPKRLKSTTQITWHSNARRSERLNAVATPIFENHCLFPTFYIVNPDLSSLLAGPWPFPLFLHWEVILGDIVPTL